MANDVAWQLVWPWMDPFPTELWRLNLPGQAIVQCLLFQQAGVWGVALKVNGQTEDVAECPSREEALAAGEQWRRDWPSRVVGTSPFR